MQNKYKMERLISYIFEEKSHHMVLNVTQRYLSLWGSYVHGLVVILIISLSLMAAAPVTCNDSSDVRLSQAYITQTCTNQALQIESEDGAVVDNEPTKKMVDYHRYIL